MAVEKCRIPECVFFTVPLVPTTSSPAERPTNLFYVDLVLDNSAQREARLKLWTDFNRCWLALLQKQRETSESELESDQTPPNQTTRIKRDYLEKMGSDLIELCNDIEKWGLVDYELGVWEEEIIDSEFCMVVSEE